MVHDFRDFQLIIVGSGFFGSTIAEHFTREIKGRVLVIEKRHHIGGNSYTEMDAETNIDIHKYGSHIFHTNNLKIWNYVNTFSQFNNYRHHVYTIHEGKAFSFPINLSTLSQIYGKNFSPTEAKLFMNKQIIESGINSDKDNFESKGKSLVGEKLYNAFIEGYTFKQWGIDPKDLPSSIISRIPVRFDFNTRYFDDTYEGIPIGGYTLLIKKMLDNELTEVLLGVDYFDIREKIPSHIPVVYTGPIDKYFDYQAGRLNWRTLDFEISILEVGDFQGNSVINYADKEIPYTRIHEFKHLHPEKQEKINKTVIMKEYSRMSTEDDEPYYPVNSPNDALILEKYRKLMNTERNIIFGGRLGTYKYLDMHMAIGSAISVYENQVKPLYG
jgi:UDP-galactopyranose mutase